MANANANMVNRTSNTNKNKNTTNTTNDNTNNRNNSNTNTNTNTTNTNNKWLMDRIHGQSKYNDNERPPNPCCWVSPIVGYFPVLFETNVCCRWFGAIGFGTSTSTSNSNSGSSSNNNNTTTNPKNELVRFYILHFGFLCNIMAVLLSAYAALSISLEYFLLCKSSLFEINIIETTVFPTQPAATITSSTSNTIYFGFSGIGIENQQSVIGYKNLCNDNDNENNNNPYLLNSGQSDCNNYNYFSMNSIISILISLSLFVPTFFMTQIRMYSGYDSNCVKNTLTILGIVIVLLNLNIILSSVYLLCFNNKSFMNNQDDNKNEAYYIYYDREGNAVGDNYDDTASYYIEFYYEWNWSWGLILLVTGTGLKCMDLVCNILVSTPTITRNKKEQEIYETI